MNTDVLGTMEDDLQAAANDLAAATELLRVARNQLGTESADVLISHAVKLAESVDTTVSAVAQALTRKETG